MERSEERGLRENSAGDHQHRLHNEFLKITHKRIPGLALIGTHTREIENLSQRGCGICLNIRAKVEQGKPGHKRKPIIFTSDGRLSEYFCSRR